MKFQVYLQVCMIRYILIYKFTREIKKIIYPLYCTVKKWKTLLFFQKFLLKMISRQGQPSYRWSWHNLRFLLTLILTEKLVIYQNYRSTSKQRPNKQEKLVQIKHFDWFQFIKIFSKSILGTLHLNLNFVCKM